MQEEALAQNDEIAHYSLLGRIAYRAIDRLGLHRSTGLLGWVRSFDFLEEILDDSGDTSRQAVNNVLRPLPFQIPSYIEKPMLHIGRVAPVIKLVAAVFYLFHELGTITTDNTWKTGFKSANLVGKTALLSEVFLSAVLLTIAIAAFCITGFFANAALAVVDGAIGMRDSWREFWEANEKLNRLKKFKAEQLNKPGLLEEKTLENLIGKEQLKLALDNGTLSKRAGEYQIKDKEKFRTLLENDIKRMKSYKSQARSNGFLSTVALGTGIVALSFPAVVKSVAAVTYLLGLVYLTYLVVPAVLRGLFRLAQWSYTSCTKTKGDNAPDDITHATQPEPSHPQTLGADAANEHDAHDAQPVKKEAVQAEQSTDHEKSNQTPPKPSLNGIFSKRSTQAPSQNIADKLGHRRTASCSF